MNYTKIISFLCALSLPAVGFAEPCPETLDETGDWDSDGIANGDDPCCYIASAPGDTTDTVCADADAHPDSLGLDMNGNGIPAGEEGDCCVVFESGMCKRTDSCSNYNGDPVRCDKLLYYWHMPRPGPAGQVTCAGGDCICFSIGDHDHDGSGIDDRGPFDNCPTEENEDQTNTDEDLWGDACDNCHENEEESLPCDPQGSDICLPPSQCVGFAFQDEESVWLEYYCSHSSDVDNDHTGDLCDDCPNDEHKIEPGSCGCDEPETDSDGDTVADCLDECPDDPEKTEPGETGCAEKEKPDQDGDGIPDDEDNCVEAKNSNQSDGDQDGVGDECDNCAETDNPKQEDEDDNGIGDVCTDFADEYTGAFSCDCSIVSSPSFEEDGPLTVLMWTLPRLLF